MAKSGKDIRAGGANRDTFPLDVLVKVPAPKRPVVLKSGGVIMELESIDDGKGLCRWDDDEGKICRLTVPVACLYSCVPLITENRSGS